MTAQHEQPTPSTKQVGRLRAGAVANAAGLNVQTVRYYERLGLLSKPDRDSSGHRQFPSYTVTLLQLIKNAQRLGFSLGEVSEIITANPNTDVISPMAERKVAEIDREIERLQSVRGTLAGFVRPLEMET
jgi:DNA-binding transcriptional MerR regulator